MTSPLRTYAFINAKLRARISKLLSENTLQQIIKAHSLEDALLLLRDTPYSTLEAIYQKTGDLKLGELELLRDEIGLFTEIEKYLQGDILTLVNSLLAMYEIDNLKNAIRIFFDRKIRKRTADEATLYILKERILYELVIDKIMNAENMQDIVYSLEATPYAAIVERYSERVIREGSLFPLEIALDHFYYSGLVGSAERLTPRDRKESLRIIGVEIDLQNINWVVRLRSFYNVSLEEVLALIIPGGYNFGAGLLQEAYKSQNVTQVLQGIVKNYPGLGSLLSSQGTDSTSRLLLIEKILERILLYEIQRILTGYPFTIGIILSYFMLKKNEIQKVKSILNAKQYNLPEDRLQGIL